jgi:hypothetical protein
MSDSQTNCSDPLEQHKSEHRALAVLRMLGREPSYMSNEEIVGYHFAQLGLACSRAQVRECLAMLERTGLIEASMVEKLTVIRLTGKGEEAGKGPVTVEGVLRPSVDCPY